MASNQWNSNPSFQSSSGFREDRLPVRTVDNCLAELAKKAIAQGLIPEPHTFSPSEAKMQITGKDGLCWDCNPSFSEDGSPVCDRQNVKTMDLMDMATCSKGSCSEGFENDGYHASKEKEESPEKRRPWNEKDPDYFWMEIIKMQNVGVQTSDLDLDPELDIPISKFEFERSRLNKESPDLEIPMASNQVSKDDDVDGSKCLLDDPFDTETPKTMLVENLEENEKDGRHGCSVSAESDAFNNLPFTLFDSISLENASLRNHRFGKGSDDVSDRMREVPIKSNLLEAELHRLKMRITDLEIELCNKDSIIAQQDAVIHRFTNSLKSQRNHRRTVSAFPGSMPFKTTTKEKTPLSTLPEEPGKNVQEMVCSQQRQIKDIMEQLEKCRSF